MKKGMKIITKLSTEGINKELECIPYINIGLEFA